MLIGSFFFLHSVCKLNEKNWQVYGQPYYTIQTKASRQLIATPIWPGWALIWPPAIRVSTQVGRLFQNNMECIQKNLGCVYGNLCPFSICKKAFARLDTDVVWEYLKYNCYWDHSSQQAIQFLPHHTCQPMPLWTLFCAFRLEQNAPFQNYCHTVDSHSKWLCIVQHLN